MESLPIEGRMDTKAVVNFLEKIKHEIAKLIVGQDHLVESILAVMLSNGHVLLEGVPGVAKTLTAKLIAKTLDIAFSRIQFTPDLMPSDVMGTNVFNPKQVEFEFKPGPIFSNLVLIDEINRAPAKTQAALFEVMEERTITVDGKSHQLSAPFLVIATQNPVEHEGTYALPEAQLDRFSCKIILDYPTELQEVEILQKHHALFDLHHQLHQIEAVMKASDFRQLQSEVTQVHIEPKLLAYISRLVQQTRTHPSIILGASPRASVTLLNTSKALAALRGRDFVTPEDIIEMTKPVLRHRISLSAEKEMEGMSTDDVIQQIVQGTDIPR
ncbi:MAG: MoxR family ATPase [Chitinophagaceae bacterium]|nr:MoxR family ATPase [Chitinophagaceae bacterium]